MVNQINCIKIIKEEFKVHKQVLDNKGKIMNINHKIFKINTSKITNLNSNK